MYIQANENNVTMTGWSRFSDSCRKAKNSIKQKIIDAAPQATFKDGEERVKQWMALDDYFSRPSYNRLIMGGTALGLQLPIDANNRKVDKETRKVSWHRTAAKIIAGTTVGAIVRGIAFEIVEKMTNLEGKGRYSKALLPKRYMTEAMNTPKFLKNYRSALSTLIAILAMCVTNFAIDAPLTVYLTNKFNGVKPAKKEEKQQIKERLVQNG